MGRATAPPAGLAHLLGVNFLSATWHLTVFKNGMPTPVNCFISSDTVPGPTFGAVVPCVDTTDAVEFVAGDTISMQVDPTPTPVFNPRATPSAIRWTALYQ